MFLFKNTKSIVKRIGMNLAVYGFAGMAIIMCLASLMPESIEGYVYSLSVLCSVAAILGCMIATVWFFVELFTSVAVPDRYPLIPNSVLPEAVLLFELRQEGNLQQFFLTDKKTILMKETADNYKQNPTSLSFKKLNRIIAESNSAEAKKYQGISKDNCFHLAAQALYPLDNLAYTPNTAEELFYPQQKALVEAGHVFASRFTRFPELPDYARPYDTFMQDAKILFNLENVRNLESHYIAFHENEGQFYQVYDRTVGESRQSHLSGWMRIFDPGKEKPICRISKQEVRALLHQHHYKMDLYYEQHQYEWLTISLAFRQDGTIELIDERRWGREGGSKSYPCSSTFFADKSSDDFISFLTHRFKIDFSDLYTRKNLHVLLSILRETSNR